MIKKLCRKVQNLEFNRTVGVIRKENLNASNLILWTYKNGFVAQWTGIDNLPAE